MSDKERAAARLFGVGFTGTTIPSEMRELISRGISAAVFFKRNFSNASQFIDLCGELKTIAARPFLNSIDHEGGRVIRVAEPFTPIPSMRVLGETNDPAVARAIGRIMGRELRAANIDLNFAPVVDVDTNSLNPVIADRSFGSSPVVVEGMALALMDGMQSERVAACAKHFPGHGDTSQDSHLSLPRLPHAMVRLREIELPPFIACVRAGVASMMTAHIVFDAIDPEFPATMSRAVITGMLREKMGFDGVIVSDDLEMKAIANHYSTEDVIVRTVNAGVDLLLIGHTPELQHRAIDILIRAVERGDVAQGTIDAAHRRLDGFFQRFVRPPQGGDASAVIGCDEHRRIVERFSSSPTGRDPTTFAI